MPLREEQGLEEKERRRNADSGQDRARRLMSTPISLDLVHLDFVRG